MTRWLTASLVLTAAALAASLYLYYGDYANLPERIPTHWDINGRANAWKPKQDVLPIFLLMPGVMLLLTVLTVALPWLSPKPFTVDTFRATWSYVMFLAVA